MNIEKNYLSENALRGEFCLLLDYIDFTISYLKEYKLRCEDYMDSDTPFFIHTTESDDYNKGIMYFYSSIDYFIILPLPSLQFFNING